MTFRVHFPTAFGDMSFKDFDDRDAADRYAIERRRLCDNPQFFTCHAWRKVSVEKISTDLSAVPYGC